jgi:uncharacterized spore protein YtfJ
VDVNTFLTTAQDALTVRRVYAEPIERDGVTVIPAARVLGGGGGGNGYEPEGPQGDGAGFGLSARPSGAFVVKDGTVRWVPAIDPARVVTTVGVVVVAVAVLRAWVLTRASRPGRAALVR